MKDVSREFVVYMLILMLGISTTEAQVLFEESATSLGLTFTNNVFEGNGISFCDFNNDGWDDITVGGDPFDELFFYQNINGVFTLINVDIQHPFVPVKSLVWIDYDNDGDKDLFVASAQGGNSLYQNNGGAFINVTEAAGLPVLNIKTNTGSWGDYDNDGDLDLFLANKDLDQIIPNMLYRNNGNGTFTNVNAASGIGDQSTICFQGTFFDYDNDGWLDIYLINDRFPTSNILYHNNSDGTFTDVSAASGTNFFMDAMSTALDDYNADGFTDIYITNTFNSAQAIDGNVLMKNNGDGTFTDVAGPAGVSFDSVGWGASFLDADNDGRLDLYVSGSNDNNAGDNDSAAFYHQNDDETFTSITDSGFETDLAYSYGNASGDYNNDGFPEVIVVNQDPYNIFLFKNNSNTLNQNNYLKVNLEGVESNRDGYGSKLEISVNGVKQYRITASIESFLSQNSDNEIFGVGEVSTIDYLKVTWLSGQVDFIENVAVNQTLTIVEGQSPLGIDDLTVLSDARLFPNPTNGTAIFKIPTILGNTGEIKIYNVIGQLVHNQKVTNTKTLLETNTLFAGTYFVTYHSDGQNMVTLRLLKQ